MALTDWVYIDDVSEVLTDAKSLHTDTRDFCVIQSEQTCETNKPVFKLLKSKSVKEKFLISKDEIIPFIKHMESLSGGKGRWRFLSFDGVKDADDWFKYIRIYRYSPTQFIVCNSQGKADRKSVV